MIFDNKQISIDINGIRRTIYSVAAELAAQDEANNIVPELNVEVSSAVGYTSADVLDYDCRLSRNDSRRAIIRIVDAALAKQEIDEARRTASPAVKRALTSFKKAIELAVCSYGESRVEDKARGFLNIIAGSVSGENYYDTQSLSHLLAMYEQARLLTEEVSRFEPDGDRIYIREGDYNHTHGTITTIFTRGPVSGKLRTRFRVAATSYFGGVLNDVYNRLSREQTDDESFNPLALRSNGYYLGEPIRTLEAAVDAYAKVKAALKEAIIGDIENAIIARCASLAEHIGPVTISVDGSPYIVNPALTQAA